MKKNLQILLGGVQYFDDGSIVKQIQQRLQIVQGKRIDTGKLTVAGYLQQAQARIISFVTDEFTVERKIFTASERITKSS
jgi:hypothetical protein